jgi:Helix-turn-helix domain
MSHAAKRTIEMQEEPVRVLGRGLRAQRGVHLTLRTLREAAGKTQVDVTGLSQMDQADISRLEGRESFDDCQVSTLQRYLAAIGGRLELVAAFGDKRIVVAGVQAGPSGLSAANKPLKRMVGRRRPPTA